MKFDCGIILYLLTIKIITIFSFIYDNKSKNIDSNINHLRFLEDSYDAELNSEMIFDLLNIHDNLFAIKVKVGSPSQTLNLIVDISSEFSFIKVPKCIDTSCDENFEKNENFFHYDPNYSNSKNLIQKDLIFIYNNIKYEADILKDIFSFPISPDVKLEENKYYDSDKKQYIDASKNIKEEYNKNSLENFLILDDFKFFLVDENINLDADGVLGLNPFIASGNYNEFSFIEHAKAKGYISDKTFAINYIDKYHAKLYLGKNNFEKRTQNILNSINFNNSNDNTEINDDTLNKYNNLNSKNNDITKSNKLPINPNKDTPDITNNYFLSNIKNNYNYLISICKINAIKTSQSLSHFLANSKQNLISNKNIINPMFSWNCKTSHLLFGEENNFYNAISFESYQGENKEISIKIPNKLVIVEFSTSIKNIIIDISYLNLFYEKYAKKLTPYCIIKSENKISYINCEKNYLDYSSIPSINFIFNGFSYKILAKDLFEQIYGDSDNLYYRLRISFTERQENKWIFGYIFLKNNLVEFNKTKNSIIFYEGLKFDLSKFISDTKETFCFYNFFNYLFVILLVSFCMFYVYNKEKKKNAIIEIPLFLKKNYSENYSDEGSEGKYKKGSFVSFKSKNSSIEKESSSTHNLKYNQNNNADSYTDKNNRNTNCLKSKSDLSIITEDKNEKLIETKNLYHSANSEEFIQYDSNRIQELIYRKNNENK